MKISEAQNAVAKFHDKLQVSPRTTLSRDDGSGNSFLSDVANAIRKEAESLESRCDRSRANRAHLLAEEVAETIAAMADADEVELLDGLADLLYIVLGTAATFDLPLEAAFIEVHRSNMTKEKQPGDKSAARVRQKGPNYVAPDIAKVLKDHIGAQSRRLGEETISRAAYEDEQRRRDEFGCGEERYP